MMQSGILQVLLKVCVLFILTEDLSMHKFSARLIPRLLTIDQKHIRLNMFPDNLTHFKAELDNFVLHRYL